MRLVILVLLSLGLFASAAISGDFPGKVENAIKEKNFPVYSDLTYCTGDLETGVRFASKTSPEKVRKWYQEKLATWSVTDKYGTWVLYDGKPDANMPEMMSSKQITIMKNDLLPSWHGLSDEMTTEVMAIFPN